MKINIIRRIRRAYYRRKAEFNYQSAVKKAEVSHKVTGERFFVMLLDDGCLNVFDRRSFRKYKQRGLIPQHANTGDLVRDCVYRTACRGETQVMSDSEREQRKNDYVYYYASRKARK